MSQVILYIYNNAKHIELVGISDDDIDFCAFRVYLGPESSNVTKIVASLDYSS